MKNQDEHIKETSDYERLITKRVDRGWIKNQFDRTANHIDQVYSICVFIGLVQVVSAAILLALAIELF